MATEYECFLLLFANIIMTEWSTSVAVSFIKFANNMLFAKMPGDISMVCFKKKLI